MVVGADFVVNPVVSMPLLLAAPVVKYTPKVAMKGRALYVQRKIKEWDEYEDAMEALERQG